MKKTSVQYSEFIGIADMDKKHLVDLVPAAIDEMFQLMLAQAKKDKKIPDMSTLEIKVRDWKNMGNELEKVNEAEFKEILLMRKDVEQNKARYTVSMSFEAITK